jgi:hypothetical protein
MTALQGQSASSLIGTQLQNRLRSPQTLSTRHTDGRSLVLIA